MTILRVFANLPGAATLGLALFFGTIGNGRVAPASGASSQPILVATWDEAAAPADLATQETLEAASAKLEPVGALGNSSEDLLLNENVMVVPAGMVLVDAVESQWDLGENNEAAFCISRYEVTNAEYQTYLDATGATWFPVHWVNGHFPAGQATYPVVGITHRDALAYCTWIGAVIGREITLPTAKQSFRAARGARVSLPNAWRTGIPLCPVGSDPADCSVYGCYDLKGNAREWNWEDEDSPGVINRLHGFRLVWNSPAWAGETRLADFNSVATTTPPIMPDPLDPGLVPTITVQPLNQSVVQGGTVILNVAATASHTLSYQWYFNDTPIDGATAASLTLTNVQSPAAGAYWVIVTNTVLAVDDNNVIHPRSYRTTSNQAVLTVALGEAPQITQQPASQTIIDGTDATFTVRVSGTRPFTFKWTISTASNGATQTPALPGSIQKIDSDDGSTLTIFKASTSSFGSTQCSVTVTNAFGSVTSTAAKLAIIMGGQVPVIITQPLHQTVSAGGTTTFRVEASGFPPPVFQWFQNGIALDGATGTSLGITNARAANAGSYTVTVSNVFGAITSQTAMLTVNSGSPGAQGSGSSGGGGGAFSWWFCLSLMALGVWRWLNRQR